MEDLNFLNQNFKRKDSGTDHSDQSLNRIFGNSLASKRLIANLKESVHISRPTLFHGPKGSGRTFSAKVFLSLIYPNQSPFIIDLASDFTDIPIQSLLRPIIFKNLDMIKPEALKKVKELTKRSNGPSRYVATCEKVAFEIDKIFSPHTIQIPALNERKDDLKVIIENLYSTSFPNKDSIQTTEEAIQCLKTYNWPGELIELQNVLRESLKKIRQNILDICDLPSYITSFYYDDVMEHFKIKLPEQGVDLKRLMEKIELSLIEQALKKTSGNKNRAAQILNIKRTTLIEKIKKYLGRH